MAVGDTWRFILAGTFLDQAHQNVLHYKVTAQPGLDPSPTQFATAWAAANLTEYLDVFSDQYTLNVYSVQRILVAPSDPLIIPAAAASDGTIAGDADASFKAAVVSLRTGIPNRRHRGRVFLGGQAEANWVGNTMQAAYATLVQTLFTALTTPLNVAPGGGVDFTVALAVFSRLDQTSSVVTSGLIDDNPAMMRRRKQGVGI